jgi:hypothetical protein
MNKFSSSYTVHCHSLKVSFEEWKYHILSDQGQNVPWTTHAVLSSDQWYIVFTCEHMNVACHISILIRNWNMASCKWKSGNESRTFNDCSSKYLFSETAGLSSLSEKHFYKERMCNIWHHYEKKHKQIGNMKYADLKSFSSYSIKEL